MQIGKRYPYLDGLQPETRRLLEAVKHHVDPQRLLNPGALGPLDGQFQGMRI